MIQRLEADVVTGILAEASSIGDAQRRMPSAICELFQRRHHAISRSPPRRGGSAPQPDSGSTILDTAFDAIVAMDDNGRIVEFNAAAENVFGHQRARVLGRSLAVIIPPRFRGAHRVGMARYLSTGETHILGRKIEIAGLHSSGAEIPVELTVARIPGDGPPMFSAYILPLGTH